MLSVAGVKINTTELKQVDEGVMQLQKALEKLVSKPSQNITALHKNVTTKVKKGMLGFSLALSRELYLSTKIGDADRIQSGSSPDASGRDRLYFEMYKRRFDTLGIPMQPGYHAGAYSYSEAAVPELSPEVRTMQEMLSAIDIEFNTSYQLGDTFTIAAQGPAYKFMKEGKISTPSVFPPNFTSLLATYKLAAEAFK